jgi:hypothetical protein
MQAAANLDAKMLDALPTNTRSPNSILFLGGGCLTFCAGIALVMGLALGIEPGDLEEYFTTPAQIESSAGCGADSLLTLGWEGDYPEPVVAVSEELQLQGRSHPCSPVADLSCSMEPGLYHPWGDKGLAFASLGPVDSYRAKGELGLRNGTHPEGSLVKLVGHSDEGECIYLIGGKEDQGDCPDPEAGLLEDLPDAEGSNRAFLQLPCEGGQRGWLEVDEALFGHVEIDKGSVLGFGQVSSKGLKK